MKLLYSFLCLLCVSLIFQSCARKGHPDGGPKDEDAPILVLAKPVHETINFDKKNIRFYFDEYVILKDLSKQLIISPPFKNNPLITPQGTAGKYINIQLLDSLKENTTYTFNFGNAVQDNNENNALENFKYVFSTGNYIDSLTLRGSVKDIYKIKPDKDYSVLLYKIDSVFNDSVIYKQKPNYVTKTYDSINYKFTNIREGKYHLLAIDEKVSDYKFNSVTDKIGFYKNTIHLPKDSLLQAPVILFKEIQPYKFKKGREVSKGKIQFEYTGKQKDLHVKLMSKVPSDFIYKTQFEEDKDTLNYWYFSKEKIDSLNFLVTERTTTDTITVFLRKKKTDSLSLTSNIKNTLHLNDTLIITTNNPIYQVNASKLSLVNSDTMAIAYKLKRLALNKLGIFFEKKPKTSYVFTAYPNAIEDLYFVKSKDTISYKFSTKEIEDYGSIILSVEKKVESPVIIELLKKKEIVKRKIITISEKIQFNFLEPEKYTIRAVVDDNKNGTWDTGNYLSKKLPERIIYYPEELPKLRANWVSNLNFIIEIKRDLKKTL